MEQRSINFVNRNTRDEKTASHSQIIIHNEEDQLKSGEKTFKTTSKLYKRERRNEKVTDDFRKKQDADYQLELEKNKGIPKNFKSFLNKSPEANEKYIHITNNLKIIDSLLCLTSFTSIIFAVVDNDVISMNYSVLEDEFILEDVNNIARILIIVLNLISVFLIIKRYKTLQNLHILEIGSISDMDDLFTTKLFGKMIIEIIINSVFNPPLINYKFVVNGTILVIYDYTDTFNTKNLVFYNTTTNITQKVTSFTSTLTSVKLLYNISPIITFIILLRIYHCFRVIHTFSYWNSLRARTICKNMSCEANLSFGLKAYLKIKPFLTLFFTLILFIIFFGLGEKLSEFYNKQYLDALCMAGECHNAYFIKTMKKFENLYNSLWLIIVTMSTIGYGDIYPTTYFGRLIAIFACLSGTFVMSLLVVFLNNAINFDEIEKHVYNGIIEEKFERIAIQKAAVKFILKSLEYNFLRKRYPSQTALYRFKLLQVDMVIMAQQFKLKRIVSRKNEIDINGILGAIKYNVDHYITPFKNSLDDYNRERVIDSNNICKDYLKNSMQMVNLLKLMNKNKYLDNLKGIDDVYDSQVNIVEEVYYYHKIKDKLAKINIHSEDEESSYQNTSSNEEKSEREDNKSEVSSDRNSINSR